MSINHELIDFNKKRDKGITGKVLFKIYGMDISIIRKLVLKFHWNLLGKHHQFYSETLRNIFRHYHDVEIGLYSHGYCFVPGAMPPGARIGRYCSFASGITIIEASYPADIISTHDFFINSDFGYTQKSMIASTKITIGNDVWIGQNAIIQSPCSTIGNGAVIAAGVVVDKDIPPYSVVVGHPCRIIRKRFSDEKIFELLTSRWWERSIEEISSSIKNYQVPIEGDHIR